MSKSNATETDVLNYVFNATAFPWNANANLYVALHTANPDEAGTQLTNETAYANYVRAVVARTSGGWTVSGNQVSNAATITFNACSGAGSTVTHVSIGTSALPSAGQILYSGALASPLVISSGVTPQFGAGALVITED